MRISDWSSDVCSSDLAFRLLLELMEDARFWVKVSGSERISREGPPFHDAARYGRLLVERFPDRVLWGTDWPHPNISKNMPDDGALVDLLEVIAPRPPRSEEHTSELQSLMRHSSAVFCLKK